MLKVKEVKLDLEDFVDQEDEEAMMAWLVLRVIPANLDHQVLVEKWDRRAQKVPEVSLACLDPLGQMENLD